MKRSTSRILPIWLFCVLVGALLGGWTADTLAAARGAQQHLDALQRLAEADDLPSPDDARLALGHLAALRASLARLQRNLGPLRPLVGAAADVSSQARRLDMALRTLDLGLEVVAAGDDLGRAAEPLLTGDDATPVARRLGDTATRAIPLLNSAQIHLDRAAAIRPGIDRFALEGRLAPLGQSLDRLDRVLPTARQTVTQLARAAPALSAMLGLEGPRSYLVLGQNQAELRATGGFIGSLGRVTLDQGEVVQFSFGSSTQVDDPNRPAVRPPQELARFMNVGAWYIRDANWWADFRTSAAQVERFWEADRGSPIHGVVAVDDIAVGLILDAIGPISVPELGGEVSGRSFAAAVQERMARPDAPGTVEEYQVTKSRILSQAMEQLVAKLPTLTSDQGQRLARALWGALQEKHILVALHEPRFAELARARDWDGALLGAPHQDFLYLVDTTLSYSEAAPYLKRDLRYQVEADHWGRVTRSVLEVTYRNLYNPAQASRVQKFVIGGTYWDLANQRFQTEEGAWGNYVRLFVPKGTRLHAIEGLDYPPRYTLEGGKAVLGGFFVLRPGETRTLRFDYTPPVTPGPDDPLTAYRLVIQKQPGVLPYPIEVQVTLASRDRLAPSAAGLEQASEGTATWRTALAYTSEFALRLP